MRSFKVTTRTNFIILPFYFISLIVTLWMFSTTISHAKDYTLDTGDLLQITILERPSANGVYTIGVDGMISIPGLGVLKAVGETPRSFEGKLLILAKETISEPSLAIQIVQYRPFFILGDVKEAGQHAYVPGISVMQAVALAKGFGRQTEGGDALTRKLENLRAQQSFDQYIIELVSMRIRMARLLAEQSDADSFEYQIANDFGLSDKLLQDIIVEEQRVFEERTNSFRKNLELSKRTLEARQKESDSYDDRIASQNNYLRSVSDELAKTKELRKQGLISMSKLSDLVRKEISTRGEVLQTRSLLRQAESSEQRSKQEVYAIESSRKVELATTIQTLSESISKLEARIDGEIAILSATGGRHIVSSEKSGHIYELYRNGILLGTNINLKTAIEPGDTLFVIKKRLSGTLN